jgi:hypothetical protein
MMNLRTLRLGKEKAPAFDMCSKILDNYLVKAIDKYSFVYKLAYSFVNVIYSLRWSGLCDDIEFDTTTAYVSL